MKAHRRPRGALLAALPAILVSGCGIVLGLNDYSDGTDTSSTSGTPNECTPGTQKACLYTGPPGTESNDPCHAGTQVCKDDGSGYSPCEGEVLPAAKEDCGNAVDDDCNGMVNDGCPCAPGSQRHCYTDVDPSTEGKGLCVGGLETCNADGMGYGSCVGEVTPVKENCATPDDEDCDGVPNQGCPCTPNTTAACYTGPAGTENVGICKGGMQTCAPDGLGYGPCNGETLPDIDDCSNATDEDCDGSVCGQTKWAKALPNMTIHGVGVDGAGNVYVAAGLFGTFTMGAVTITPVGMLDAAVLKFDAAGNIQWGKRFGSAANDAAEAIAVDAAGNVHITGYIGGNVDFGGGSISTGVYVTKLSPAGAHVWSKGCGGTTSPFSSGRGVALDATGNVLVTGQFGGTVSCAIGQSANSAGGTDAFVIRMSGVNGGPIWTKAYGDAGNAQYGFAIAADGNGDALVTGEFFGNITFGGLNHIASGSGSIFVAKLTAAAGGYVWSKSTVATTQGNGIAADAAGNAIFTGLYSGATTFGGLTVQPAGAAGDILFGRLDAATGNADFLLGYGGANGDNGNAAAVSPTGRIAIGGNFRNSANFGGGALASASLDAAFVATFDGTPTHLWSKQFSSATLGPYATNAVAFAPDDDVVAGGQFFGMVDFGTGVLTAVNGSTGFLVRVGH